MRDFFDMDRLIFRGFCATFFLIPLGTSPFLITGYLTVALWVLSGRAKAERRRWASQPWVAPVVLFAALHWTGLIYTDDIGTGLGFASKTHYWIFAFAMASVPFDRYRPKAFIDCFLAGLSVAALLHIGINAGVVPAPQKYASGFMNPITYILLLTFGMLMLSYYFAKTADKGKRALYVAGILLYLASVSLFAGAPGRSALLTLILTAPVIVYNLLGQGSLRAIAAFSAVAVAALLVTPVVQSSITDAASQVSAYFNGSANSSVGLRLHMWAGALRIFAENPLIGTGTGGYTAAMAAYATPSIDPGFRFSQPHNSFLYMAANFGAIGVLSLLWLLAQFVAAGWKEMDTFAGFSILAFGLIVAAASFTDTQIIQVHTGILLAMLTGLQAALRPAQAHSAAPGAHPLAMRSPFVFK